MTMTAELTTTLSQQVLEALAPFVEPDAETTLTIGDDGTIVLVVDGVVLGVQVQEEGPIVRVFGVVEAEVDLDADLAAWLNEYNASRIPVGYVFWRDREVIYTNEVIADPLVTEHLMDALAVAASLVPALVREEEYRALDGDMLD